MSNELKRVLICSKLVLVARGDWEEELSKNNADVLLPFMDMITVSVSHPLPNLSSNLFSDIIEAIGTSPVTKSYARAKVDGLNAACGTPVTFFGREDCCAMKVVLFYA